MVVRIFLASLCIFVMSNCAYRWGVSRRSLPGGVQNISLDIFENKTQEPQVEVFFTNALMGELERSKVALIVDDRQADGVMSGVITSIEIFPAGRREGGDVPLGAILASEYRILITARVSITRKSDGKLLWSHTSQGERTYVAPQITQSVVNTLNPLYNQSARRLSIEVLSKQMMSETFALMTESF